jgi:hypothetical protein
LRAKSPPKPRRPKRLIISEPLVFGGELYQLWAYERVKLFAVLRKYQIPEDIIGAVEDLDSSRPVRWVSSHGTEPVVGGRAWPILMPRKKGKSTQEDTAYQRALPLFEKAFEMDAELLPSNAGELLAYHLIGQLRLVDGKPASPVRTKGRLARSRIAAAAIVLLEDKFDGPPGPNMIRLLRALLNIDVPDSETTQLFWARHVAADILAQDPTRSLRAVARMVNVSAITLSRWKKEPEFNEAIEKNQKVLSRLRPTGSKKKRLA